MNTPKFPDAASCVDAQIDAYVARDTARFAACYAQDASCVSLTNGRVLASNRDEIARVWGELFARREARFELVGRLLLGNLVIDHERVTNVETGFVVEAIAAYEVREGLIQRVWFLEPHA
jgi:hypothetical protein